MCSFVVSGVGIARIETTHLCQQIGIALLFEVEAAHHQFHQRHGLQRPAVVFPARVGTRAGVGRVEPVPIHFIGVMVELTQLHQQILGRSKGSAFQVRVLLDQFGQGAFANSGRWR